MSDMRREMLREAQRILKKNGRLVIIDWSESFGNIGPKPDHVVSASAAKLLCQEAGFEFLKSIHAGEHHYGFIVKKV